MDIELERKAFEAWHESKYGEHVTWANGAPVSHIHDDRWQGWRAAKARAVPEGFVLVPREPTEAMQDAGCSFMPTVGCQPYDAAVIYKKMIEAQLGLPATVLQSLREVS